MRSFLSRLFPASPAPFDQVSLRFTGGDFVPLTVEVINSDGSIAAAGPVGLIADWLAVHGFTYAWGSPAVWVRA